MKKEERAIVLEERLNNYDREDNIIVLSSPHWKNLCNHKEREYILSLNIGEDNHYYDVYYHNNECMHEFQFCIRYGDNIEEYLSWGSMGRLELHAILFPESLEMDVYYYMMKDIIMN